MTFNISIVFYGIELGGYMIEVLLAKENDVYSVGLMINGKLEFNARGGEEYLPDLYGFVVKLSSEENCEAVVFNGGKISTDDKVIPGSPVSQDDLDKFMLAFRMGTGLNISPA